jgi:hypothetical protein
MQISFATYIMTVWAIGFSLALALTTVDDRIVQYVCRKEGRQYSWMVSWFGIYWQIRKLSPSWFRDAREAGYLKARVVLVVAFISLVVGASILSRSGLAPEMPPRRGQATILERDPGSPLRGVRDDAASVI